MKNYSFGTPLSVRWHFTKPDGTPFDLGGFTYTLKYRCGRGTGVAKSTLLPGQGDILVWTFTGEEHRFTGIYDLELTLFEGGRKHSVCKYVGAFSLEKKSPEQTVVHEIVTRGNNTFVGPYDGPDAVIDTTVGEPSEYALADEEQVVDLFTAAEWFACSHVKPMAGSDGFWRYDGEIIRDDKGTPVRWKPNIVVTDEVPALGDTEEGVIYRIMDGQKFTDYAMVDGDIVSVDSGRLLDLEAKVNNLKAEDVLYNGSLRASTVKEALDFVASHKASQSQVDILMTTKADKSQVATLNQDVAQMGYDLTQKASKAKVEDLEETVTSHGERLCTIDDVLGTKATVGELANVNSAVAVNAQGIVDVNTRIDGLKAQDIFYKGGGSVQTAIDKVKADKAEQSQVDAIASNLNTKQEKLVSGSNIKTINGQTILGSGNIEIQGGGGSEAIELPYLTSASTTEEIMFVVNMLASNPDGEFVIVQEATQDKKRRNVAFVEDFSNVEVGFYSFTLIVGGGYNEWLERISIQVLEGVSYYSVSNQTLKSEIPSTSDFQRTTYRQNVLTSSTTNYPSSKGVIDYVSGQLSPINTALVNRPTYLDLLSVTDTKADKMTTHTHPVETSIDLIANCYNEFDRALEGELLEINNGTSKTDEYVLKFSTLSEPIIVWNNVTSWVGGEPTIEANKTYLVSIQDGIGIIVEV